MRLRVWRPRRRSAARAAARSVPLALRTPRAAIWWIGLSLLLVGGTVGGVAWWLLAGMPLPGRSGGHAQREALGPR
ncbi:hypothetical protein [Nonomuraea sp. NPDC049480]|uniref:hypothetical protein n=1 Tax=Nonomuraea sp. NPDC049480 TaxID=3364353 RepID=UPI0037A02F13